MIEPEFLEILVCPETHMGLQLANKELIEEINQKISRKEMMNKKGEKVKTPIDGGLLRSDTKILYPIRDQIPDLLIEEGILL